MRKDYKKLMVIGSGPIVIGQAAEFDFSGTQACRSLREEGYKTVLVNSNPATIQTDPDTADSVYIEPLTASNVAKIIEKEGVDGVLSGMGGQTALNICSELADSGELDRLHCSLVGTQPDAIAMSEDRELFKETMERIGEPVPVSRSVNSIEEAKEAVKIIGRYPVPRRHRRRDRPRRGGAGGDLRTRSRLLQDPPGPDRGVRPWMEGVRVRGHEGLQRQLHHHMQHGEPRRHGNPHPLPASPSRTPTTSASGPPR